MGGPSSLVSTRASRDDGLVTATTAAGRHPARSARTCAGDGADTREVGVSRLFRCLAARLVWLPPYSAACPVASGPMNQPPTSEPGWPVSACQRSACAASS